MTLEPEALEAIARVVRDVAAVPVERRHWDIETIAAYHGCSVSHARQNIVCQPDFPKAIRATGRNSAPRWVAGEVMSWFEERREQ